MTTILTTCDELAEQLLKIIPDCRVIYIDGKGHEFIRYDRETNELVYDAGNSELGIISLDDVINDFNRYKFYGLYELQLPPLGSKRATGRPIELPEPKVTHDSLLAALKASTHLERAGFVWEIADIEEFEGEVSIQLESTVSLSSSILLFDELFKNNRDYTLHKQVTVPMGTKA